jgi:hypothetical protein
VSTTKAAPPSQRGAAKVASGQIDGPIITDWSVRMRDRRRRTARLAEQAMPLVKYYQHHGGPLLAVPIGEYYARGRWAA